MIWQGPDAPQLAAVGSMAIDPIEPVGREAAVNMDLSESVMGVHSAPAFVVFHTPPAAAPRYAMLLFLGSTAIADTRPELFGPPLNGVILGPAVMSGCGPMSVQLVGPGNVVGASAAFEFTPRNFSAALIASTCCNAFNRKPVATEPFESLRSFRNHSSRSRR